MRTKKADVGTRICDEGIALDSPVAQQVVATATKAPPFRHDDWAVRQRVRNMDRELRRPALGAAIASSRSPFGRQRLDPPQNLFDGLEAATSPVISAISTVPVATTHSRPRHSSGSQIVAWLIVIVGIVALGSGSGIMAWSLSARQMTYWNLALGLALGGQGTLIFGLVLVVARLWRSSRHAVNRLHDVHARLSQLQHTTDALTAMRSGGAPAFYADLVRGASPQMLLSNLKGQVDQLATRLGSG